MIYSIVDIETTGGNNKQGRITEIAAYLHDGHKIVDSFITLVNPERPIPPFITRLTRISNEMVSQAPRFEEIAEQLDRFTANCIFVAHNVHFDYNFIREEYRRLGKDFKRKILCTVQLSRKTFPGLPSYSLNKITRQLDIELDGHHRAAVDAKATVHLFEKILEAHNDVGLFDAHFGIDAVKRIKSPYITSDLLRSIPDDTGIYRLYNRSDELIFVKRSSQILSALCSKLKPNATKDSKALLREVYRIDWQITGSALVSQLIEAEEVLSLKPHFNHGKFSIKAHFGLFFSVAGNQEKLTLLRSRGREGALYSFSTFYEGVEFLDTLAKKANLKVLGKSSVKQCSPYLILNNSLEDLLETNGLTLIVDEADTVFQRSIVLIQDGLPLRYGVCNIDQGFDYLEEDLLPYRFSPLPELGMILRHYTAKEKSEKTLFLKKDAVKF